MSVSRRDLVLVMAAWAAVRLVLLALLEIHGPTPRNGDVVDFLALARSFADHASFIGAATTFQRDPGYPLLLAGTLWAGWPAIYALQSLLTLGVALLTARRLGLAGGLLIAACPFFPPFEWVLLSEIPAVATLWCGALLILRPARRADLVLGATLLGMATAVRLALLPAAIGALLPLLAERSWRKMAGTAAALAVPLALALTVPHEARGRIGFQLWIGTWERAPGWMDRSIADFPPEAFTSAAERAALTQAARTHDDAPFLSATLHRLRTEPGFVLRSWLTRYRWLWLGTRTEAASPRFARFSAPWYAFKAVMWMLNLAVLLAGLAGGASALRRRERIAWLLTPVAAIGLVYLPFHSVEIRYSLSAVPFLLALASSTIQRLGPRRTIGTPQRTQRLRHSPGASSSRTALTTERL